MVRNQTLGEEIANAVTHGVGAALGIAALAVLVMLAVQAHDAYKIVAFSMYGASIVLLYLASTLYHAIPHPKAKRVFQILDHMFIFVLIAGTYTPFLLISLRGVWGWSLFFVIWVLAIIGIVSKAFLTGRYAWLSTMIYLGMGWLIVIALRPLLAAISMTGIFWLFAGGAAYTLGVICFALDDVPYMHFLWHIFVLMGSTCHFIAILLAVAPVR